MAELPPSSELEAEKLTNLVQDCLDPSQLAVNRASCQYKHIFKSDVDSNIYKSVILENGIELLIVSNPIFTTTSCAISVGVGSFDEPADWPGIAHFLEHMLFMGTEKYPGENEFQNFLACHNGYSNAYTADDHTLYYCEVDAEVGAKMLDMLAWFFISPLFIKDAVNREISAVDSEFKNSKNSKYFRMEPIMAMFNKEGDYRGRFSCGNDETLRRDGILEEVIKFWKEEYCASKIKVAVCSAEKLEKINEEIAVFSRIKNNRLSTTYRSNKFENTIRFDAEKLIKHAVHIKPLDSKRELFINICMPSVVEHFKTNSYQFLSFLFTSEESGKFISRLKQANLGTLADMSCEVFIDHVLVKISIELTDSGLENYEDVLNEVSKEFNLYHRMALGAETELQADSILMKEYERFSKIKHDEFRFLLPGVPLDLVQELAVSMRLYPTEHLLDWPYICSEYSSQLVQDIAYKLYDKSNWLVVLLSDVCSNDYFDRIEYYYGTKYKLIDRTDVQPNCMDLSYDFKSFSSGSELPGYNFELISSDHFDNLARYVHHNNNVPRCDMIDSTFVFDSLFNLPKTEVFLLFKIDPFSESYESFKLFFNLALDQFVELRSRLLDDTHIDINLQFTNSGILLKFDGFTAAISNIFCMFCSSLYQHSNTFPYFDIFKRKVIDSYAAILKRSPYDRLDQLFLSEMFGRKRTEEQLEELKKLTKEDLRMIDECSVKLAVIGNISHKEVNKMINELKRHIKKHKPEISQLLNSNRIRFKTYDLGNKAVGVYFQVAEYNTNIDDCSGSENNTVLQSEHESMKNTAIGRMIYQISNEKFFNELRTEEELGYCVAVQGISCENREYLGFKVQSTKSTEFIEERILRFIDELKEEISKLDDEEYSMHKESVISYYKEPILNMEELGNYVWKNIQKHKMALDYNERMSDVVGKLTKDEIIASCVLNKYVIVASEQ